MSASAAATIARRLASEHPGSMLPCPACGAEVKAPNLDGHLTKVHELPAGASTGAMEWTGSDRRMRALTFIPVVLWLLMLPLVLFGWNPVEDRALVGAFAVGLVVLSVPVVMAYFGRFKATLRGRENGLTFCYAVGLLGGDLTFPARLEPGELRERLDGNMVKDGYGYRGRNRDVHAGRYLRLTGANGRSLTLGSRRGTALKKFWDATAIDNGGVRRLWDVDLEPEQLAQLQYLLAEKGILRVR
jgi:hypothetical protein